MAESLGTRAPPGAIRCLKIVRLTLKYLTFSVPVKRYQTQGSSEAKAENVTSSHIWRFKVILQPRFFVR